MASITRPWRNCPQCTHERSVPAYVGKRPGAETAEAGLQLNVWVWLCQTSRCTHMYIRMRACVLTYRHVELHLCAWEHIIMRRGAPHMSGVHITLLLEFYWVYSVTFRCPHCFCQAAWERTAKDKEEIVFGRYQGAWKKGLITGSGTYHWSEAWQHLSRLLYRVQMGLI